jgi:gentisate 1,2-dioxygenase
MSDLQAFEHALARHHLAPLWRVMRALAPRAPAPSVAPAFWSAALLREQALAAGRLISAADAERRVLVLENPALPGESRATSSLYAGVQLLLPGETARAHRHTASALRLILEGEGAHTSVEDERVRLHRGDFVITPSWKFHAHGNDGAEPVLWLDGLDVPLVNLLGVGFSEDAAPGQPALRRPEGDSLARYGAGVVPVDFERRGAASPLFCYPYQRTREALQRMRRSEEWDAAQGLKVAYTDPTTGRSPIPTMGAFMQLLPAGFVTCRQRVTDGAVFAVVEGHGRVEIAAEHWDIAPGDIFVVPGWTWHRLQARAELILFSFSDRPLQQQLYLWREQRAAD